MTHKEKSANLNAKCSGGHFEFRKLASAQPPVWPVVATENSRKFPKRRLKRNWEQFLVKKWCFQKSHKICEIFGLLLSTQDLTKAAQSVPIAFPISLFLLYCGSIKLKNKMINKQWYARNGETVGRKKTLLVLAWDADWPYCYIIIHYQPMLCWSWKWNMLSSLWIVLTKKWISCVLPVSSSSP